MKSWTSKLLVLLIPLCSMGVGKCDCITVGDLWCYIVTGKLLLSSTQAIDRQAMLAVGVGENGRIATAQGVPPFSWLERASGVTQRLNHVQLSPVDTSQLVLVVGNDGTILRSTDIGATWSPATSGTLTNLNGLSFTLFQEQEAFAVGDDGVILRSSNAGATWSDLPSGTSINLRTVVAITSSIIVAAGSGGIIRRTENGGATWNTTLSAPPGVTFNRITFDQGSTGGVMWAVGSNGAIYFSSTYGASWVQQTSNTTQQLNDVHFRDGLVGVALGNNGTVRHTTNGGVTWLADTYLNSLTTEDIRSAFATVEFETTFTGAHQTIDTVLTGVVITSGGINTVSNTTITGVGETSPSLPTEFALHQNYPNPFNPSTHIPFSIQTSGHTTLTIHDLLGREVATLVDGELDPGLHEAAWDATGMVSGVYFCRLSVRNPSGQSGSFMETRKLLLLQ